MYGIALVQNVPRNLDGLPKLIKSVFNPEPNHYGSYYVVEQKENIQRHSKGLTHLRSLFLFILERVT